MDNLTITKFDIEQDLSIVKQWESTYKDDPRFDTIKHFILEDHTYYGLDEVIYTNYEFFHIDDDEQKFCFAIKNKNQDVVGFILSCMFNMNRDKAELIIQYIVLRPDYQHLGYGKEILSELICNSDKYFPEKAHDIYANIDQTNTDSRECFKSLGFVFSEAPFGFVRAHKTLPNLNNDKE